MSRIIDIVLLESYKHISSVFLIPNIAREDGVDGKATGMNQRLCSSAHFLISDSQTHKTCLTFSFRSVSVWLDFVVDLRGPNLPGSHQATVPTHLIRASSPARPSWQIAKMVLREKPRGWGCAFPVVAATGPRVIKPFWPTVWPALIVSPSATLIDDITPGRPQARHDGSFPANGWKPYPLWWCSQILKWATQWKSHGRATTSLNMFTFFPTGTDDMHHRAHHGWHQPKLVDQPCVGVSTCPNRKQAKTWGGCLDRNKIFPRAKVAGLRSTPPLYKLNMQNPLLYK